MTPAYESGVLLLQAAILALLFSKETSSSIVRIWSVTPASIAEVTQRLVHSTESLLQKDFPAFVLSGAVDRNASATYDFSSIGELLEPLPTSASHSGAVASRHFLIPNTRCLAGSGMGGFGTGSGADARGRKSRSGALSQYD